MSGIWPRRTWPRWIGSTPYRGRRPQSTWGLVGAPPSGNFSTHSITSPRARSRRSTPDADRVTLQAPTRASTARGAFLAGSPSTTSPKASVTRFSGPQSATRSCLATPPHQTTGSAFRNTNPAASEPRGLFGPLPTGPYTRESAVAEGTARMQTGKCRNFRRRWNASQQRYSKMDGSAKSGIESERRPELVRLGALVSGGWVCPVEEG